MNTGFQGMEKHSLFHNPIYHDRKTLGLCLCYCFSKVYANFHAAKITIYLSNFGVIDTKMLNYVTLVAGLVNMISVS